MKIKKHYRDALMALRDDLLRNDVAALEAHILEIGLDTLFQDEFIRFVRIMDARQVLVLVSTLGVENADNPKPFARLLAIYQCVQGAISVDQAVANVVGAGGEFRDFYRDYLNWLVRKDLAAPYQSMAPVNAECLGFAIELALDLQQHACVVFMLKQWMKLNRSDKPWLQVCRWIAERTETVMMRHVAEAMADMLEQCLQLAPASQPVVTTEMFSELAHLRVLAKQGAAVLAAAKEFGDRTTGQRANYLKLRGLMLTHQLDESIQTAERLLIDLLNDPPTPEQREEDANKYTFQVEPAERTLQIVNQALRAKGLQPFLMSGTLLGYERNRGVLPHDKDVDIGIMGWENQFAAAQALIELGHFYVHMTDLRREKLFLLAPKDTLNAVAIDLFFFHDKGDHFLHGIDFDNGYTQNFRFSKFGLKDVDFLGQKFFIPDNADQNLTENYGDWHTPQPSYVVTVESPAIMGKGGLEHRLSAHLEVIKTVTNFMPAQRVRRLLAYQEESGIMLYSKLAVRAMEQWLQTQPN